MILLHYYYYGGNIFYTGNAWKHAVIQLSYDTVLDFNSLSYDISYDSIKQYSNNSIDSMEFNSEKLDC